MAEDMVTATKLFQSEVGVPLEVNRRTEITCYRCRGQGYMARDCAMRQPDRVSTQRLRQVMRCFKCNKISHFASECQENGSEKNVSTNLLSKQVKNEVHHVICILVDG